MSDCVATPGPAQWKGIVRERGLHTAPLLKAGDVGPPVEEVRLRVLSQPISLQTHPRAGELLDAALAEGKRFPVNPTGLDPFEADDP